MVPTRKFMLAATLGLFACSNDPVVDSSQVPSTGAPNTAGSLAAGTSGGAAGKISTPVNTSTAGSAAAVSGATTAGRAAPAGGSNAAGTSVAAAGTNGAAAGSGAGAAGAAAGSGGANTAGSGGSAGSDTTGGGDKATHPCLKKGSQVVFIGDSYINYDVAHTLLSTLIEQRAVKDGALKQGETYRNYAIPGTALAASNLLGNIPPQWDQAVAADPDIKFVIMDGGGNDVLLDHMECLAAGSDKDAGCQQVVADTLRVGTELLTKIKNGGVTDAIYFFYPHVPAGGNDINDYSLAMLQDSAKSLATPTFRTFVVDLIPIFEGHDNWIASDGIHANDTGENIIADEIWKLMKANCIAQPESSGCCTP